MKNVIKMLAGTFMVLIVAGCSNFSATTSPDTQQSKEGASVSVVSTQVKATFSKIIKDNGIDGLDALALLKKKHQVKTKDFGSGMGEFVQSIDGQEPSKDQFWSFYINGKSSNVGASSYTTKTSDVIEWKLENIDTY